MDSPGAANWREVQTGKREFECPFGKPVIKESLTTELREPAKPTIRPPADASLSNIAKLIKEWTTGEMVSDEVADMRKAICAECEYQKESNAGKYCAAKGGCGCTVEARKVAFLTIGMADMTRWAERLRKVLCAHPKRFKEVGKGWPK